ncbi:mCG1030881, partial [Mus musculus]
VGVSPLGSFSLQSIYSLKTTPIQRLLLLRSAKPAFFIQDPKLMKQCHLHSEKVFLPQLILEPSSQTFPGLCLWVILDPVTLIVNINHYSV